MNVLAMDTACGGCSVALWADGRLTRAGRPMTRGHAEALMPMIATVMAESGVALAAVDRIGVTVGPGAFTGVRIGLASARGLALALGRPAWGVTTFDAVAHGPGAGRHAGRRLVVVIESRREDLFVQEYHPAAGAGRPADGPPRLVAPATLAVRLAGTPVVLAGDGAARVLAALAAHPDGGTVMMAEDGPGEDGFGGPDAAVVARLVATDAVPALAPVPLYLRPPDVTLPAPDRAP